MGSLLLNREDDVANSTISSLDTGPRSGRPFEFTVDSSPGFVPGNALMDVDGAAVNRTMS